MRELEKVLEKLLVKVMVGLIVIIGSIINTQANDANVANYANSSWTYNLKINRCVKLSEPEFNEIYKNLKFGVFIFIGGIELHFNSDPNDWSNPESAVFFIMPISREKSVINVLATTIDSCETARQEVIDGNVQKRFPKLP